MCRQARRKVRRAAMDVAMDPGNVLGSDEAYTKAWRRLDWWLAQLAEVRAMSRSDLAVSVSSAP